MTLTHSDARHLLRRTGYGGLPADVDELVGKTRAQAVDIAVSAVGYTSHAGVPTAEEGSSWSQRRDMQRWWVDQMALSPAPMVERLVYFWHSHLAGCWDTALPVLWLQV